jgi:hypothetical protein
MTTTQLTSIAAVILSLACSYLPGLSAWYEALNSAAKRLLMLGLLVLAAAGAFSLACAGFGPNLGIPLACDQQGAFGLLQTLIMALVANQATYLITPKR